jgi:hypothetical protein
MSWDDVLWHVLNFAMPALVLSLGMTAWGSFQFRRQTQVAWGVRWAVNALGGLAVLVAGLVMTGHDGKMATYGAMVLVSATLEWAFQVLFKRRG